MSHNKLSSLYWRPNSYQNNKLWSPLPVHFFALITTGTTLVLSSERPPACFLSTTVVFSQLLVKSALHPSLTSWYFSSMARESCWERGKDNLLRWARQQFLDHRNVECTMLPSCLWPWTSGCVWINPGGNCPWCWNPNRLQSGSLINAGFAQSASKPRFA